MEIGPGHIREIELRIGQLPQQKVGQPLLSAGSDQQVRIRQPRPRTSEGGSAAFQALALYASPSAQAAVGGSMPFATPGYFPGLWEDAAAAEAGDGPAKRKDSLMIIRTEDGSARQVAAILTALHASHVKLTPGLPRS